MTKTVTAGRLQGAWVRLVVLAVVAASSLAVVAARPQRASAAPVKARMHFRNGAVAISYMSTLLLRLVDDGRVSLEDPISKWLPHLRDSHRVTLGMLAGMTAGYHDYEEDPRFVKQLYNSPFTPIGTAAQLRWAFDEPQQFTPGSNWSYSHSDYVILGLALRRITGMPLSVALRRMVLKPLGLRNTIASQTASIPPPVLHAYSSERQQFLGIPKSAPFTEESTYWNPAWTRPRRPWRQVRSRAKISEDGTQN